MNSLVGLKNRWSFAGFGKPLMSALFGTTFARILGGATRCAYPCIAVVNTYCTPSLNGRHSFTPLCPPVFFRSLKLCTGHRLLGMGRAETLPVVALCALPFSDNLLNCERKTSHV